MSFIRELAGYTIVSIEFFGFFFNVLAVYLIKRQGFKTVDMWLSLIIAVGDIILILVKLSQWIFFKITNRFSIFDNKIFSRLDIIFTIFSLSSSMLCIGMLAALRYWVIVKSNRLKCKYWIISYIMLQGIFTVNLIYVSVKDDFILMPFGRYFFPNIQSKCFLTRSLIVLILVWCLFSIISVNICYINLTQFYLQHYQVTSNYYLGYNSKDLLKETFWKKVTISFKMMILLLIYDLGIIPPMVVVFIELIQNQIRSSLGDNIFGLCLMSLTLINPLTLIFLHQETLKDLKLILNQLKLKISSKRTWSQTHSQI